MNDDGQRRAKFTFDRAMMHRTLGLPDDVRVVSMHVTPDPDQVHVVVEGAGVPGAGHRAIWNGDDYMAAAYDGDVGAWMLPHPYHNSRLRVRFGWWKVGELVPMELDEAGEVEAQRRERVAAALQAALQRAAVSTWATLSPDRLALLVDQMADAALAVVGDEPWGRVDV